jgi:hypothetical protein
MPVPGLAMARRRTILIAITILTLASVARTGHELPVYPSYYPHEIEIASIAREAAGELLSIGKMHAYLGRTPQFASAHPEVIGAVESLGSLAVIRLNPGSPWAKDLTTACAVAETLIGDMAKNGTDLIIHPYPVTPFHGDYLNHVDLAEAAKARVFNAATASEPHVQKLKVRAESELGRGLVRPAWLANGDEWDAAVEVTDVRALVSTATVLMNGWFGPPWIRSGWFHAHHLLVDSIADPAVKQQVNGELDRLQRDSYESRLERINMERELVKSLTAGCGAMVVGYTVKREYFNAEFSAGIENIGYDALEGLSSPIFLRTVKLKDFPWNGWLQIGIEGRAESAWNPIGGFTDDFGRLMYFAVSDPAVLPSPYDATWMLNRFSDVDMTPRR